MTIKTLLPSILLGVLLIIGAGTASYALKQINEYNQQYDSAYEIWNEDDLKHTTGNSFIYGELKALDIVSLPEVAGEYMYIKKVKQVYTKHKKLIPIRSGKTTVMNPRYYHSWDNEEVYELSSKKLSMMGMTFPLPKIEFLPEPELITTITESDTVRYKYYGCPSIYTGTLYTYVKDSDIYGTSKFFTNTIQDTKKQLKVSKMKVYALLIIWSIVSIAICIILQFKLE